MSTKPGVMIYFDLLPALEGLSKVDMGVLFQTILRYGKYGVEGEQTKRTALIWPMIKMRLDTDNIRYLKTVNRKEYAAYVRWAKRKGSEPVDFLTWQEQRGYSIDPDAYFPTAVEEYNAK